MAKRKPGRPKLSENERQWRKKQARIRKRAPSSRIGLPRRACDAWLILVLLVREGPLKSAVLSEKIGVAQPTVLTVLRKLKASGIVRAKTGPAGGYYVSKAPDDVTMHKVAKAVCGELFRGSVVSETKNYPWFTDWFSCMNDNALSAYERALATITLGQCLVHSPDDIHVGALCADS